MEIIYHPIFLEHYTGRHPENSQRLLAFKKLEPRNVKSGEEFLELVHSPAYIKKIKKFSEKGTGYLDMDTPFSEETYEAACYAVGAAVLASDKNDFALVRPPGHHAGVDRGGGFCFFNNLAIAVKRKILKGKKVFILDFDSHFGDGTAEIFYEEDRVLYSSLHQYPAYPSAGWVDEIGDKKGKGYTVNIPLPARSGDDLFIYSLDFLLHIARQFKPDLIAVSAGFDGHHSDLLLGLNLSSHSYYQAGKIFSKEFENIFATLEGGYSLKYLPKLVYNFIAGVNKKRMKFKEKKTKSPLRVRREYEKRIEELIDNLAPYWDFKGLKPLKEND
ncbi:MAG: histone deacetylase family protein [Candidatus Nealsonbacteria bacterium]|nr:histone deacetylase family protein [Candidatus Nealsonbacteria bacterium]